MARADDADRARDPSRRAFFRTFGQQTVRNAGAVIGAAAELRRSSTEAARELLDLGATTLHPDRAADLEPVGQRGPEAAFSSPYRLADDALMLLDQRELPGHTVTLVCRPPSEVASALRAGVVNAGPVMGEIAAYALVIAVGAARDGSAQSRDTHFRAAANTLRTARPDVRALAFAVERMEAGYEALASNDTQSADLPKGLRDHADALALDAANAHAAIGRAGSEAILGSIKSREEGLVNLLMHGDSGPLSCGLVGMGTAIVRGLTDAGHSVHVWVTEAAPGTEGARLSALQLTQLDIPHTVIADSAVAWVLANRLIDGVLLRGDRVCLNGDTGAVIGSRNVALLAHAASVAVHVCAPTASIDPSAPDSSALAVELRSAAEELARGSSADLPAPANGRSLMVGSRLNPRTDVVPAELVSALLTEAGELRPSYEPAIRNVLVSEAA
jgi:methylthioribose-1-phosphate isomerase